LLAGNDGLVVLPRARAAEILKRAQEVEFTEHSMFPYIENYNFTRRLGEFGRI
jgi:regulator of RNase E activity RraA